MTYSFFYASSHPSYHSTLPSRAGVVFRSMPRHADTVGKDSLTSGDMSLDPENRDDVVACSWVECGGLFADELALDVPTGALVSAFSLSMSTASVAAWVAIALASAQA
jgi:hypothetical protein